MAQQDQPTTRQAHRQFLTLRKSSARRCYKPARHGQNLARNSPNTWTDISRRSSSAETGEPCRDTGYSAGRFLRANDGEQLSVALEYSTETHHPRRSALWTDPARRRLRQSRRASQNPSRPCRRKQENVDRRTLQRTALPTFDAVLHPRRKHSWLRNGALTGASACSG